MANDQGKTGHQGGTTQPGSGDVTGGRDKDAETGRKGGQMPADQTGRDADKWSEQGDHGSPSPMPDDRQGAGGAAQRGGQGGHSSGTKADQARDPDLHSDARRDLDDDTAMNKDER